MLVLGFTAVYFYHFLVDMTVKLDVTKLFITLTMNTSHVCSPVRNTVFDLHRFFMVSLHGTLHICETLQGNQNVLIWCRVWSVCISHVFTLRLSQLEINSTAELLPTWPQVDKRLWSQRGEIVFGVILHT